MDEKQRSRVGSERYVDILVTVDEHNRVTIPREGVEVFADDPTRPDAVRWVVAAARPVQVQVKWEVDSPFRNLGVAALGDDAREHAARALGQTPAMAVGLVADGNLGFAGLYRYSVLVTDDKGAVLGGADPWIKNNVNVPLDFG